MKLWLILFALLAGVWASPGLAAVSIVQAQVQSATCGACTAFDFLSDGTNKWPGVDITDGTTFGTFNADGGLNIHTTNALAITNTATAALALGSATSYALGDFFTAGSCSTPAFGTFTIANGAAIIPRVHLISDDLNVTTGQGWQGISVAVDIWDGAPTMTGSYPACTYASGGAGNKGTFTCTMSSYSTTTDGQFATCSPQYGSAAWVKFSGTTVTWTARVLVATMTVTASKHLTLIPEVQN